MTTDLLIWIAIAYLLIGALCFLVVDRAEMSKPVPYGDVPAIASLSSIRASTFVSFLLGGVPMLVHLVLRRTMGRMFKGRTSPI